MMRSEQVPEHLKAHFDETTQICSAFLRGLSFVAMDAARDPKYLENHLLSYVFQEFLQSAIAIPMLAREGVLNVCRRELRFVLEAAIKLCFVQQEQYAADVAAKVSAFKSELNSPSISLKNRIRIDLIPDSEREAFSEEVGRLYGATSNYVHLTTVQLMERVRQVNAGQTSGYEAPEEVDALNKVLARGLACSLVLLFHAVPEYVAGDMLVEADGSTAEWYFTKSKYVAMVDAHFDYKHERQARLEEVREARRVRIVF